MEKQRARGNSPDQTRKTDEVRRDFGYYRSGIEYREWLEQKLKEANESNTPSRQTIPHHTQQVLFPEEG